MAKYRRSAEQTRAWQGYDRMDGRDARVDWLKLLVMMLVYVLWFGTIYFLEPGIR